MDDKSAHLPGKEHSPSDDEKAPPQYVAPSDHEMMGDQRGLSRALQGRHMQMIAIGMHFFPPLSYLYRRYSETYVCVCNE